MGRVWVLGAWGLGLGLEEAGSRRGKLFSFAYKANEMGYPWHSSKNPTSAVSICSANKTRGPFRKPPRDRIIIRHHTNALEPRDTLFKSSVAAHWTLAW